MLEAGEAYAAGDVAAALGKLGEIVSRGGKTLWEREALFLRAKIREKDSANRDGALRDLRTLSVRHPATPAAAFGQFRIARLYEEGGELLEAYREYVLCARLRPVWRAQPEDEPGGPGELPALRLVPEAAARLVGRAALRAARLLHEIPDEPSGGRELPPGTFVVQGGSGLVAIPADPADRPAPLDRADVWYVVAPGGSRFGEAALELSAAADPMAAGPQAEKRYSAVLEPLPPRGGPPPARGPARVLALSGSSTSTEKLERRMAIDPPAGVLRLTLYRNGSRVAKCELRLRAAPAGAETPARPQAPDSGFVPATPAVEAGAGGPALAPLPAGGLLLVYHSPGPAGPEEPDEDADIFAASSPDGLSWEPPRRLAVSSAADDLDPTLAVLGDGRLLLAWTSDRRGAGTSDIYISESRDALVWTRPVRLEIAPGKLESIGPRALTTFHVPALHVDSAARVRLFFVARGLSAREELAAAGLYGVASADGRLWGEPSALISTPQVHLDRWKPVPPRGEGKETVSHLSRPAAVELAPGRIAVLWLSSWGRVFLSTREGPGRWATSDLRVAGSDAATAARCAGLVGPLGGGGGFGILLSRRDIGATALWPVRSRGRELLGWRAQPLALGPLEFEPGSPASSGSPPGGSGWITAWVALRADGPSGVYVRRLAEPGQ